MATQKHLSIQKTFTLIATINGGVLAYLTIYNFTLLRGEAGAHSSIYVSLLLTMILSALAIISYRIIFARIVSPLAHLVEETRKIESNANDEVYLTVRGRDEVSLLAHRFNILLSKMRQAFSEVEASNKKLIHANSKISESLRYAGYSNAQFCQIDNLEMFLATSISSFGSLVTPLVVITTFSTPKPIVPWSE